MLRTGMLWLGRPAAHKALCRWHNGDRCMLRVSRIRILHAIHGSCQPGILSTAQVKYGIPRSCTCGSVFPFVYGCTLVWLHLKGDECILASLQPLDT